MRKNILNFSLLLGLQFVVIVASAQTFSPFSQFGLGTQRSTAFSSNKAMGGIAAGFADSRTINFTNPASYASLDYTVFSLGANVLGNVLSDSALITNASNGSVNHVAFAFPVMKNKWGMSIGLLPYTNMNYIFRENNSIDGINYENINSGGGSTYQFYLGNGFKFGKFSAGLNAALVFGQLDYTQQIAFADSLNYFNSIKHNEMVLKDVTFNVGLQYSTKISRLENEENDRIPIYLTAGVYGAPPIRLDAFLSEYNEATTTSILDGSPIPVDTAVGSSFGAYDRVMVPGYFGTGLTVGNEATWLVGLDFHYENWKNFSSPITNQNMVNDWKVKFGGQIIPKFDGKRFGQRVEYRLGGHLGKSRINLANTALPDFGMSFGLGLPFKKRSQQEQRALSKLNLTFELGRLGQNTGNVLKQNYYQLTIGYSLSDVWFIKRKFD